MSLFLVTPVVEGPSSSILSPKSSQREWLGFGAGGYGMECEPISPCSSSASLSRVGFVNVRFNYTEHLTTQGKSDVQFASCGASWKPGRGRFSPYVATWGCACVSGGPIFLRACVPNCYVCVPLYCLCGYRV